MTFDIYASTSEQKKSSKSEFGAEFVATITDFGEAARPKVFFKNPPQTFNIIFMSSIFGKNLVSYYIFYCSFNSVVLTP